MIPVVVSTYLEINTKNTLFIMALPKGTKRFQHNTTGEIRYFRNEPNLEKWTKVGTPGSKDWRWINNNLEERYVHKTETIPTGFVPGRIKS